MDNRLETVKFVLKEIGRASSQRDDMSVATFGATADIQSDVQRAVRTAWLRVRAIMGHLNQVTQIEQKNLMNTTNTL